MKFFGILYTNIDMDHFNLCPDEMIEQIFKFIPCDYSIMIFTSVCRRFFYMFNTERKNAMRRCWDLTRACRWEIPAIIVDLEDISLPTEEEMNEGLRYLIESGDDIRRGDIVHFESCGYRNDGICIFTGKKIINLTDEIDDYGHVPSDFSVITEFPFKFWEGINHNYLVPVSKDLREEILRNLSMIKIRLTISCQHQIKYVSGETPYSYVKTELGIFYFLFLCCHISHQMGELVAPGLDETRVKINNSLYYNRLEEIKNDYELIVTDVDITEQNTLVMDMSYE